MVGQELVGRSGALALLEWLVVGVLLRGWLFFRKDNYWTVVGVDGDTMVTTFCVGTLRIGAKELGDGTLGTGTVLNIWGIFRNNWFLIGLLISLVTVAGV